MPVSSFSKCPKHAADGILTQDSSSYCFNILSTSESLAADQLGTCPKQASHSDDDSSFKDMTNSEPAVSDVSSRTGKGNPLKSPHCNSSRDSSKWLPLVVSSFVLQGIHTVKPSFGASARIAFLYLGELLETGMNTCSHAG